MSLSSILESLRNKTSIASEFITSKQSSEEDSSSNFLRGIDNNQDSLSSVGENANSRLYTVNNQKDGNSALVVIEEEREPQGPRIRLYDEADTAKGTTLSRLQVIEKEFVDENKNRANRIGYLKTPSYLLDRNSAVKDYIAKLSPQVTTKPVQITLSSNFGNLFNSVARDKNSSWYIPEPKELVTGYTPAPVKKAPVNPVTSIFNSFSRNANYLMRSAREIFGYEDKESSYKVPDEKPWEKNQKLALASASVSEAELGLSSSGKSSKKDCKHNTCRLDSRLKMLADSAGIPLESFMNLDNQSLSKILLTRGVSPFRMLGIFESMGKNFLSSLALLRKNGKEHLFSDAIVRGLDVSSTAAADQYALQISSKNNGYLA